LDEFIEQTDAGYHPQQHRERPAWLLCGARIAGRQPANSTVLDHVQEFHGDPLTDSIPEKPVPTR
jgi:hypothetical protein